MNQTPDGADLTPASQAVQGAFDVLLAWMFTPTGALLLVMVILFGGADLALRAAGRAVRWLGLVAKACAGLFAVWVVGGILEAWGIPVREWIGAAAAGVPGLAAALVEFFKRLLLAAG